MVFEVSVDQITHPFTQLPDPNRVIVLVDAPPREDDDDEIYARCVGKYKGDGFIRGVLDHGIVYFPAPDENYRIDFDGEQQRAVEIGPLDEYSWYYLSDDISDDSDDIKTAVEVAKNTEIDILIDRFYNAVQGHPQDKDRMFSQLDPEVQAEVTRRMDNFYNSIRNQPVDAKQRLFRQLPLGMQTMVRRQQQNITNTNVALMPRIGADPVKDIIEFNKSGGVSRRRKRTRKQKRKRTRRR